MKRRKRVHLKSTSGIGFSADCKISPNPSNEKEESSLFVPGAIWQIARGFRECKQNFVRTINDATRENYYRPEEGNGNEQLTSVSHQLVCSLSLSRWKTPPWGCFSIRSFRESLSQAAEDERNRRKKESKRLSTKAKQLNAL